MGKIIFIAKSNSFEFEITGGDEKETISNTYTVLYPFVTAVDRENDAAQIATFQQNTEELRIKVRDVVELLSPLNVRINRLADYFEKRIQPDEWFYIAVDKEISDEDNDKILMELMSQEASEQEIKVNLKVYDILQNIRSVYNISTFGEFTKAFIGEPDKAKRVCRYCKRSMPDVSFKEVAHTISEALGNKCIKTNDECDECNHFFGDTIEQDFLSIFQVPRLIFNIKGKSGFPHKFLGDNYTIEKDEKGNLSIGYHLQEGEGITETEEFLKKVLLRPKRFFPEQNLYKTLCKYLFGVLDDETLKSFDRTRHWLLGETTEKILPKLARFYHPEVIRHPRLMVYVRKGEVRKDLPHVVGEIRIVNLVFIVILPFSEKDVCLYNEDYDYERFWNFFDVYSSIPNWRIGKCDGLESKHPTVALRFIQKEDKE